MEFHVNLDLKQNMLVNARMETGPSAPSSPVEGMFYFDNDIGDKKGYFYNGTSWVSMAGGGIANGFATVTGDTGTANASGADSIQILAASANHASVAVTTGPNKATITINASATAGNDKIVQANGSGKVSTGWFTVTGTGNVVLHTGPTFAPSGGVSADMGTGRITNVVDPSGAQDAATKAYVDAVATGLDVKKSVRVASTATVTVTYNATNGTSARGQITAAPNTLDGVSLAASDRIALKNQSTGAQNGLWVVTTLGSGANGVWDRATDFDQDVKVTAGAYFFVEEGTTNADTGWVLSNDGAVVIGGSSGTALTFVQFSAAGQVTASNVGTGSGAVFKQKSGITLQLNNLKAGSTKIAVPAADGSNDINLDVNEANLTLSNMIGPLSLAKGGTNAADAPTARDSTHLGTQASAPAGTTNVVPTARGIKTMVTATLTHTGSATSFRINHNLNSFYLTVQVYKNSSGNPGAMVAVDVTPFDANNVDIIWAVAQANSTVFHAVVVG